MIDPAITATHEASHAAMAHLLGVRVRRVALLPDGGGVTELDPLPEEERSVRLALVVIAAGEAGEVACGPAMREERWWALA